MKFAIVTILLALLPGSVASQENWLEIVKSEDGFRFSAPAAQEKFSFNVPGEAIRTAEDSGRVFADIDGATIQILRVPLKLFPGKDKLAGHKEFESKSLEASGVHISPSEFCSQLLVPHQEWRAELPSISVSRYLTFQTKRSIIVIVVSASSESSAKVARHHLDAVCASLRL